MLAISKQATDLVKTRNLINVKLNNYIRTIIVNERKLHKVCMFVGVLEEAEFYNITALIKLVKDKIHDRDNKKNQVTDTHTCQNQVTNTDTIVIIYTRQSV